MSGILLRYKIGFCENKETKNLAQRGEGASMTTQSTRGGGNQAQGRKKQEHIGRFKLFLQRNQYCARIFVYT